jgi:hypothetical protein
MTLTQVEQDIITILREAKPYEVLEIQKDQSGKPDYYLVKRTQKVVIKAVDK